jgi:hypothetical protein
MAPTDEIEYLKSLVKQLNEKIVAIEAKAKKAVTPAEQLRTILIGPPGAGTTIWILMAGYSLDSQPFFCAQVKAHKPLEFVTNSVFATWQLGICFVSKLLRKLLLELKPRRSWMLVFLSRMKSWSG